MFGIILPKNGHFYVFLLPKNGHFCVVLLPKNGHIKTYQYDLQKNRKIYKELDRFFHQKSSSDYWSTAGRKDLFYQKNFERNYGFICGNQLFRK
jgi:hypothetical protein